MDTDPPSNLVMSSVEGIFENWARSTGGHQDTKGASRNLPPAAELYQHRYQKMF